jgi:anti-sigma regulatory factor (Ser/Thr protein kinase)
VESAFESPVELALRLRANDLAPAIARRALRGVRDRLGNDLTDDAELLISELVTNSVRHGDSGGLDQIDVIVSVTRRRVRVEVSDTNGFRWDLVANRMPAEQGGFGLVLLANLANRWGVHTGPPTCVWFEIDRLIEVSRADGRGKRLAAQLEPPVQEVRGTVRR